MTPTKSSFSVKRIPLLFMAMYVCAILFSCNTSAQSFDNARLDSYFDTLAKHNKFMGSIALAKDGKIFYTKAVGFADVETQKKSTTDTKYRIGSITKTFTTVLVMKAVQEKKLQLSRTLAAYFPSIINADKITISDLLYHRSGIHNFTANPDYSTWNTQKKNETELVDIIVKSGSDFEPGSKSSYSNSNFVLLSFILEKIYKQPYAQLLSDKIIDPSGLKNTYYGAKINPTNNETHSYLFSGSWQKQSETDMSVPIGAGAIVSTPSDLVLFAEALFTGKLVSQESLQQMQTLKDRYGMGLITFPFYGKTGFGHTGGIDGFNSVFSYFPEDKIAFALISNGTNFDNNNISIAALSAAFGRPYDIPSFTAAVLSTEELSVYTGQYTSKTLSLPISIFVSEGKLMAQATGQSAFALSSAGKDSFSFDPAGIALTFQPAAREMILVQGGRKHIYTKQ